MPLERCNLCARVCMYVWGERGGGGGSMCVGVFACVRIYICVCFELAVMITEAGSFNRSPQALSVSPAWR